MGSRSLERYPERSGLCGTHEVLGSSIGRCSTGGKDRADLRNWAIGLGQSVSVCVAGRTKDAQAWVLAFCAMFL